MNITPEIACVVSRAIGRPKQMRQAIPFQANASQSITAKSIIATRSLSIEKKRLPRMNCLIQGSLIKSCGPREIRSKAKRDQDQTLVQQLRM